MCGMTKKSAFKAWIPAVVVLSVILVLFLGAFFLIRFGNFDLDFNFNFSGLGDGVKEFFNSTIIIKDKSSNDLDFGEYFYQNAPGYITAREIACENAGGRWLQKPDKVGCYNIPAWNYTYMCSTGEVRALRAICINIQGVFFCGADEVSCERI